MPYHYPANVYIKQDNPEIPTFYFDPVINPISAYKVEKLNSNFTEIQLLTDEELEELDFGKEFGAILRD